MQPRFEQFIKERQYLTNVTPRTIGWYTHSLRWLASDDPTESDLKDTVLRMRKKGLKATGCNSAIRAINSFLHWNTAGTDRKCSPACEHLRVAQLKEPQLILPTFTAEQIKILVQHECCLNQICRQYATRDDSGLHGTGSAHPAGETHQATKAGSRLDSGSDG